MTIAITVLQIIACILLIASVLFQQPKGGGSVFGGTSQSVFGSSGGTTFLFRISMWSAVFIMASSLFLAWYRNNEARNTVVDYGTVPTTTQPAPTTDGAVPPASTNAVPGTQAPGAGASPQGAPVPAEPQAPNKK